MVSLLWRLPSMFDPPWVNDEGTYFAVAQAMAHGFRLYENVWENKPPGIYLLYSAVYHSGGASLGAIRVIAAALTAVIVILTYRIAVRPAGPAGARVAALVVGLLLGVPVLEGTTLNAELPLAALTAAAVYAALEQKWTVAAGACMVAALAFKVVAGFDCAALGIWLFLHRRDQVPGYLIGMSAAACLGAFAVWQAGILHPMLEDAFLYDLGYVGHGNGGGSIPWLLAVKFLCLCLATVALRRAPWFYLWSVWAVAGVIFSGRVFGHYTLQAVVPLCVTSVTLYRARIGQRAPLVVTGAFIAAGLIAAAAGWALVVGGHDSILARRLQYYVNFGRYALRTESYTQYEGQIDDHVARNQTVAATLRAMPAGNLLVWGNTPWVYVLSGRLPATPFTSSLRTPEVPGESAALRHSVQQRSPAVVVVIQPAAPAIGAAQSALSNGYRRRRQIQNATIYARIPGS